MYATNYFETKILNLARSVSLTAPAKLYLGLFLNNPEDTGGGTEISYSGYSRKEIKFDAPISLGNAGLEIRNSELITFAQCNANIGNVGYIGIFDAATGGNMLLFGQLTTPIAVQHDVSPIVRAQMIRYIMTGNMNEYYRTAVLNTLRGMNCSGFTPYLALFNGSPDSGGIEFVGNGYARVAMNFSVPSEQSNGNSQTSNTSLVTTPEATGLWGQLTHVAIYDAAANGHAFMTIPLDSSYNVTEGTVIQFQPGKFKMNIN